MPEIVGSGYYCEVLPANSGNAVSFTISASTSATEVKASSNRLNGRRGVLLKNRSDVVVLWGFSSTTCYFPLEAESSTSSGDGGSAYVEVGDNQGLYIITASGSSKTVACAEVK